MWVSFKTSRLKAVTSLQEYVSDDDDDNNNNNHRGGGDSDVGVR
jgi:hypothetical protein